MIKIQRFRAYDLIASLVIVCLLLFLLFTQTQPALAKAKPKAMWSNCIGNLKQLGNAAWLYEGDNAGKRPGPQPLGPEMVPVSWDRPLAIQMGASLGTAGIEEPLAILTKSHPAAEKILSVFACPADLQEPGARMIPAVPGSLADGTAPGPGICRSYTLNLGTGNLDGQDDGIVAMASTILIGKVDSPAGTVFLIENHGYATVFGQTNIANDTTLVCTRQGKLMPADVIANPLVPMHGARSNPRGNALMYDGHVEAADQALVTANGGQIMQYGK